MLAQQSDARQARDDLGRQEETLKQLVTALSCCLEQTYSMVTSSKRQFSESGVDEQSHLHLRSSGSAKRREHNALKATAGDILEQASARRAEQAHQLTDALRVELTDLEHQLDVLALATAERENRLRSALVAASQMNNQHRVADTALWQEHASLTDRVAELEATVARYAQEVSISAERTQRAIERARAAETACEEADEKGAEFARALVGERDEREAAMGQALQLCDVLGLKDANDSSATDLGLRGIFEAIYSRIEALKAAEKVNSRLQTQHTQLKVGLSCGSLALYPIILLPRQRVRRLFSHSLSSHLNACSPRSMAPQNEWPRWKPRWRSCLRRNTALNSSFVRR
jgi:hypothetical protein